MERAFSSAEEMRDHYKKVRARLGGARREPVVHLPKYAERKPPVTAEQAKRDAEELSKIIEGILEAFEAERISSSANEPSRLKRIIKSVSIAYGVSVEDILGPSRMGRIIVARQVAMYLCRQRLHDTGTEYGSFPQIGRAFGGRDHTTVLHAYEKIKKNIRLNNDLRARIDVIESDIDRVEREARNGR